MTVEQYFALCENFDWYYDFTEDFTVWQKGKETNTNLMRYANQNSTFMRIYTQWKLYNFSGVNFGTKQCPKPVLEDFL
jgi:hypothetical protein